jgi:hypothetical protein
MEKVADLWCSFLPVTSEVLTAESAKSGRRGYQEHLKNVFIFSPG